MGTMNKIPDEVLKEIFPKRLKRREAAEVIYAQLKKMILSGKLKKGKKLVQEKIAQDLDVSIMTVIVAFSQLRKDGLIVSKRGVGSFVV